MFRVYINAKCVLDSLTCGFFFLDDFADPEGISKFANPPGSACVGPQ